VTGNIVIEVQALSKVFGDPKSDKAVRAVDDVTFSVKAGEIFAFLGPAT
jgi:ABC-type oligopeptide transport system ATPase subunit